MKPLPEHGKLPPVLLVKPNMTDEIPGELISAGTEVLSKVGNKLVTKVSKGIGGWYRPIGLKRMAKAEGEARIILAKADAEVAEIQQRAMHRLAAEETRRQINFEAITVQALPYLKDESGTRRNG